MFLPAGCTPDFGGKQGELKDKYENHWLWSAGNMQTSDCRTNHTTGQLKTRIVAPLILQI